MADLAKLGKPKTSAVSWPWHLRDLSKNDSVRAGSCKFCACDVAIPSDADLGVCIYCAMDRGMIPAEDAPLEEYADPVRIVTAPLPASGGKK